MPPSRSGNPLWLPRIIPQRPTLSQAIPCGCPRLFRSDQHYPSQSLVFAPDYQARMALLQAHKGGKESNGDGTQFIGGELLSHRGGT